MAMAMDTVEKVMKMTIIWYLMASIGLMPAKIKPVIIPGKATMPNVFALSMVGSKLNIRASRKMALQDCIGVAPKANLI